MSKEYNESSLFCSNCTSNKSLINRIQELEQSGLCSVCNVHSEHVVSFVKLANWVEVIWREWYQLGLDMPNSYDNSDKIEYTKQGDEPELLISELINCLTDDENVTSKIIEILSYDDYINTKDGGDLLINSSHNYVRRDIDDNEVERRWKDFSNNIKHHTRYFNSDSIAFLDNLFKDIDGLNYNNNDFNFSILSSEIKKDPVICNYSPGSLSIFRARKINNDFEQTKKILNNPEKELSNPPDHLAKEGRMNPKGISYFYGSKDRETCVSELRVSISEEVLSAEFELTRSIKLLNFNLLARVKYDDMEGLFDENYFEDSVQKKLLIQLHRLIAKPIIEGDEFEYLPTQFIAEYLARRHSPTIDGIIFNSVQRESGENIVIFPHNLGNLNHSSLGFMHGDSAIRLIPNSIKTHKIKRIEYYLESKSIDTKDSIVID